MGLKKIALTSIAAVVAFLFAANSFKAQIVSAGFIEHVCQVQENTPTPTNTPIPEQANTGGGGGSNGPSGPPTCDNPAPYPAPDLFQIDTTDTTATLYFTPNNGAATFYFVEFGFHVLDESFGGPFPLNRPNQGVQSATVTQLTPNTTYFFRVRPQDGCKPGEWSNTMKIVTDGQIYYHYDAQGNMIPLIP